MFRTQGNKKSPKRCSSIHFGLWYDKYSLETLKLRSFSTECHHEGSMESATFSLKYSTLTRAISYKGDQIQQKGLGATLDTFSTSCFAVSRVALKESLSYLTQEWRLLSSQVCKSSIFLSFQLGKLLCHHAGLPSRSSSVWHPWPHL